MRHYFLIVALGEIFYGVVSGQHFYNNDPNSNNDNFQYNPLRNQNGQQFRQNDPSNGFQQRDGGWPQRRKFRQRQPKFQLPPISYPDSTLNGDGTSVSQPQGYDGNWQGNNPSGSNGDNWQRNAPSGSNGVNWQGSGPSGSNGDNWQRNAPSGSNGGNWQGNNPSGSNGGTRMMPNEATDQPPGTNRGRRRRKRPPGSPPLPRRRRKRRKHPNGAIGETNTETNVQSSGVDQEGSSNDEKPNDAYTQTEGESSNSNDQAPADIPNDYPGYSYPPNFDNMLGGLSDSNKVTDTQSPGSSNQADQGGSSGNMNPNETGEESSNNNDQVPADIPNDSPGYSYPTDFYTGIAEGLDDSTEPTDDGDPNTSEPEVPEDSQASNNFNQGESTTDVSVAPAAGQPSSARKGTLRRRKKRPPGSGSPQRRRRQRRKKIRGGTGNPNHLQRPPDDDTPDWTSGVSNSPDQQNSQPEGQNDFHQPSEMSTQTSQDYTVANDQQLPSDIPNDYPDYPYPTGFFPDMLSGLDNGTLDDSSQTGKRRRTHHKLPTSGFDLNDFLKQFRRKHNIHPHRNNHFNQNLADRKFGNDNPQQGPYNDNSDDSKINNFNSQKQDAESYPLQQTTETSDQEDNSPKGTMNYESQYQDKGFVYPNYDFDQRTGTSTEHQPQDGGTDSSPLSEGWKRPWGTRNGDSSFHMPNQKWRQRFKPHGIRRPVHAPNSSQNETPDDTEAQQQAPPADETISESSTLQNERQDNDPYQSSTNAIGNMEEMAQQQNFDSGNFNNGSSGNGHNQNNQEVSSQGTDYDNNEDNYHFQNGGLDEQPNSDTNAESEQGTQTNSFPSDGTKHYQYLSHISPVDTPSGNIRKRGTRRYRNRPPGNETGRNPKKKRRRNQRRNLTNTPTASQSSRFQEPPPGIPNIYPDYPYPPGFFDDMLAGLNPSTLEDGDMGSQTESFDVDQQSEDYTTTAFEESETQTEINGGDSKTSSSDMKMLPPHMVNDYTTIEPPTGIECFQNESYYKCVPHCQHTCFNYDSDELCPDFCEPGCGCKEGLLIDEKGRCVSPDDCFELSCGMDEEWWDCKPTCHNTCENFARAEACEDIECEAGCFCRDGLIKDSDGNCVEPDDCEDPTCQDNEEETDCMSPCNTCVANCHSCPFRMCRAGCDCKDGFKRDFKGACIHASLCPSCALQSSTPEPSTSE